MTEPSFEARMEQQVTAMGEKLDAMLDELRAMRAVVEGQAASRPAPNDVLPLEEAAAYVGVRPETLRKGAAGTHAIARYRDRPVQFLRSSLDRFKRDRVEREANAMRRPVKKISLVRRKPRA